MNTIEQTVCNSYGSNINDKEHIKFIFNLTKNPVTKTHFKTIIRKHCPNECVNALLDLGYIIDKDDFELSLNSRTELDLSKQTIILDQGCLELCSRFHFYPDYNFKDIDQKVYKLIQIVNKESKKAIIKYLDNNYAIPEKFCLIELYHRFMQYRDNHLEILNKFIECGLQVSILDIKSVFNKYEICNNDILFDLVIKNMTNTTKKLEDKIKLLEDKLKSAGIALEDNNNNNNNINNINNNNTQDLNINNNNTQDLNNINNTKNIISNKTNKIIKIKNKDFKSLKDSLLDEDFDDDMCESIKDIIINPKN